MNGIDPSTPAEWREAVNAAHFALAVDSAVQYGLLKVQGKRGRPWTKRSGMDVERCVLILEQGKALGILPEEIE